MTGGLDRSAKNAIQVRHYVGIFLLSFAALLLELSLTRVFSVALWHHYGFLIISTALLGFGSSGSVLSAWRGGRTLSGVEELILP